MTILLWGLGSERPLAAVREELNRLGLPVLMLDQREVLETMIRLYVGHNLFGNISLRGESVDLATVSAAYLRPYNHRRLPSIATEGLNSRAWHHALAVEHAITSWSEMTEALVVNRPQAMAANGSKPYQLEQIRELGFRVPETIITTDPDAALKFWELHETVIYKSVGGTRSIVSRLRPEHKEHLANVAFCPTQFQRYVPGTDYRVHVVGNEIFASEVISEADDYRYPEQHEVEVRDCCLPRIVEDLCRRASEILDLPVAGIDLRRTPDGDWYCFEVNPSPAFTYYENRTGQQIGKSIAMLLAAGSEDAWRSVAKGRKPLS